MLKSASKRAIYPTGKVLFWKCFFALHETQKEMNLLKNNIIKRGKKRRRGEFKVFNHPSLMANKKANELIRKLEKGKISTVISANGKKIIEFTMLEDGYIYLLTETGKKKSGLLKEQCQKISIDTLKHACYEFLYLKTATRSEFEKFSNYWSSLFALLITVYSDVIKKHRTPKGVIRITIIGSRIFLSGLQRPSNSDWEAIEKNGAAFVLMAYPDIKDSDNWIKKIHQFNVDKIMLDSGVFGVLMKMKAGEDAVYPCIYAYCDFIRKNKELLSWVVNLDHLDPKVADENQKIIFNETGVKPVPVWHPGDSYVEHDWNRIEDMVNQDHAVIAIGKTVGRSEYYKLELFKELFKRFPNQNFHWLGGSSQLLLEFNFFSSDSTSWYKGREPKRQMYVFEGFRKTTKLIDGKDITKEEGLTFNLQMMQNVEYMKWPIFNRQPNKAPLPSLNSLWEKVYRTQKATRNSNLISEEPTPQQLSLFDDRAS